MTLELRSVSKSFGGIQAVKDVSLTINEGERVGIIGRSGAGKSTLLRLINRLETPESGEIFWKGEPVYNLKGHALRQWRARCAMIFQDFGLVDRLDVVTNVLMGRLSSIGIVRSLMKAFPKTDRIDAIVELEWLDMAHAAFQRAGTLSGGQKQRVAIARAMMQSPDILLADEPVSALDPSNTHAVMDALKAVNERRNMTVLMNLHDMSLAKEHCSRILAMANGQVVFDGPPTQLDEDKLNDVFALAAQGMAKTPFESEVRPA